MVQRLVHAAVRRSIRAFPTSPIKFTLTEAGLPSIEERVIYTSQKLIQKLLLCKNKLLYDIVKAKWTDDTNSTISKCIKLAKDLGITTIPEEKSISFAPSWLLKESSFDLHLQKHHKKNTNSRVYQSLFKERIVQHYVDWKLIFTDASKADFYTSFAIVDNVGKTLKAGHLPNYSSVYTAEAAAIYNALSLVQNSNLKTLICTDSKSTISALLNASNKSYLIAQIRNILIGNTRIKIMWIPGHAGITGNEWVDVNAKLAAKQPSATKKGKNLHIRQQAIAKI
ncbi:uncharacterized protein LOC120777723 isoform X2 [Bactrocera tryoni]|uniref:uncharacterized protein LOC120777723 isoform X1 n=1 Tax=Bactrocera tryoni TaxID=59916 RepID=UPI001A99CC0C|nr:uncharacterized protein LOC120777723 isoform X1 [Bactrocera tryoni]XP_039965148.1 uncharacterized protein LOC120777723 isoform X2 [Bactrocera tryoni]